MVHSPVYEKKNAPLLPKVWETTPLWDKHFPWKLSWEASEGSVFQIKASGWRLWTTAQERGDSPWKGEWHRRGEAGDSFGPCTLQRPRGDAKPTTLGPTYPSNGRTGQDLTTGNKSRVNFKPFFANIRARQLFFLINGSWKVTQVSVKAVALGTSLEWLCCTSDLGRALFNSLLLMLGREAWQELSAKPLQQKYIIVIKVKTSEE